MSKTVWIIGAGASYDNDSNNCFLDNNIFEKAYSLSDFTKKYSTLINIIKTIINKDLKKVTFEDSFSEFEININWIKALNNEQKRPEIYDCCGNYYLPLYKRFKKLRPEPILEILETAFSQYKLLVIELLRKATSKNNSSMDVFTKHHLKKDHSIITTNYDTLIEDTIMKNQPSIFNYEYGYRQLFWNEFLEIINNNYLSIIKDILKDFTYIDNNFIIKNWNRLDQMFSISLNKEIRKRQEKAGGDFNKKYNQTNKKGIPILKLHGSLNWRHNQDSHFRRLDDKEVLNITSVQEASEITIIPPLINKQTAFNPISKFGRIWSCAEDCLEEAEEIVFWGYSIPPTDLLAKNMITKSIISNRNIKKIIVKNKSSIFSDFKNIFRNHFNNKKIEFYNEKTINNNLFDEESLIS